MILIGQFDSPFVRRVAIAMELYGFKYEHRPWSTFGDADLIAPFNPLRRVPTLGLDDGAVVIESFAILDWLDEQAGPEKALIASNGPDRQEALKIYALATGLADKAVALLYERVLHKETSQVWIDRCRAQIGDVLDVLNKDRTARETAYWFGDGIGHADVAVACAIRFTREAHPAVFDPARWAALEAHAVRCEGRAEFRGIAQTLVPPDG